MSGENTVVMLGYFATVIGENTVVMLGYSDGEWGKYCSDVGI